MSQSAKRRELTRQAPAPKTIVDPLADLQTANPVLAIGQFATPSDQPGVAYLGDGITAFNDLSPFGGGGGSTQLLAQIRYVDPGGLTTYADAAQKTGAGSAINLKPLADEPGGLIWLADGVTDDPDSTGGHKFFPDSAGIIEIDLSGIFQFENVGAYPVEIYADLANADYGPNFGGYNWINEATQPTQYWSKTARRFISLEDLGGPGSQLGWAIGFREIDTENFAVLGVQCVVSWTPTEDRPAPLS